MGGLRDHGVADFGVSVADDCYCGAGATIENFAAGGEGDIRAGGRCDCFWGGDEGTVHEVRLWGRHVEVAHCEVISNMRIGP